MNFHPSKCKVVSVHNRPSPLDMLPNVRFCYHLGDVLLEYADNEKDLGVIINPSLSFNEQQDALITKANQQFGLVKRTCHFVKDIRRRRTLYLTLVRSQFEHCSPIWRTSNDTAIKNSKLFKNDVLSGFCQKRNTHIILKCTMSNVARSKSFLCPLDSN